MCLDFPGPDAQPGLRGRWSLRPRPLRRAHIAVWDGQEAQGQGGTAAIVAQARQRGLPLAWIRAGNRRPGTQEPMILGEEQGKVSFERFPG